MADSETTEKERFNLINAELNSLYLQVQRTDASLKCLSECVKPFLHQDRKPKQNRSMPISLSLFIGLLSLLIYCFLYYDPLFRFMRSSSRRASMMLIPLWDWRWIHGIDCLFPNPYKLVGQEPGSEDCNVCVNMTDIQQLNNSDELLLENITSCLGEDIPVVVENVTDSWPNRGLIDVKDLKKLYLEDDVMKLFMCCDFESNLHVVHGNHRTLLRLLVEEKRTNYYAHWQNCFKESAKLFRQVYKRPEFLPSTVELTDTNWVFISSSYTHPNSEYINLPLEDMFMMLIQLEGHMDIILEPVTACHDVCQPLKFRLLQGNALIFTDFLYTAKYRPSTDEESITVGIGGSVDH